MRLEAFLVAFVVGFLGWTLCSIRRIDEVYKSEMAALDRASRRAKRDVDAGRSDWERHFTPFLDRKRFDRMCRELWKPLDSYYEDEEDE